MSLLDVIAQFIQIFVDLLPRFTHRPDANEWLVVDSMFFGPHLAKSRPVLFVPIMDVVEYWPRVPVPVDCDIQTVVTADGCTLTINAQFAYLINEPLSVRDQWGDHTDFMVPMIVRRAVEEVHRARTMEEIKSMGHAVVSDAAANELWAAGIEIAGFCIEDRAPTLAIRHYGIVRA